ncbi:hypothetical protein LTS18_005436 [Coniosporium uncinatum]|uniref:Uncharacterized protein n=1 Tax=Coniosporium uncinatum TaxID=93489 RepID=A0ACC3DRF9_9PEZI|nr:hypothetical protein LTS18_005436 [Coniosporium uncinatum]
MASFNDMINVLPHSPSPTHAAENERNAEGDLPRPSFTAQPEETAAAEVQLPNVSSIRPNHQPPLQLHTISHLTTQDQPPRPHPLANVQTNSTLRVIDQRTLCRVLAIRDCQIWRLWPPGRKIRREYQLMYLNGDRAHEIANFGHFRRRWTDGRGLEQVYGTIPDREGRRRARGRGSIVLLRQGDVEQEGGVDGERLDVVDGMRLGARSGLTSSNGSEFSDFRPV